MRQLTWLLRIEAFPCALAGLMALFLPELPIRFLSQAPVGSLVEWLDVVRMVRAAGLLLVGVSILHLLVPLGSKRSHALAWTMVAFRVGFGVARWRMLDDGLGALTWLGRVDLALAIWTVAALWQADRPTGDGDPPGPNPRRGPARRSCWLPRAAVVALATLVAGGLWFLGPDRRQASGPRFASDEEHFKYGSVMRPGLPGFPLYVFEALPDAFPDLLPGGWATLGLIQEPGRAAPVGFAEQAGPIPGLTLNCALCHSGTYRTSEVSVARFVPGAPAESLDFQRLLGFLFAAGADPRFTDGTLMASLRKRRNLSVPEAAVYQRLIIPASAGLISLARRDFAWLERAPVAGPGRQDAGTVLKHQILRLPLDGTVANSDFRPLWNQGHGYRLLHRWSGGGRLLTQENLLAAALFNAMQPALFDGPSFGRMTNYLASLTAPSYPLPVSPPKATLGKDLFRSHCADCHDPGGRRYNTITPLSELGTDGEYLAASTPEFLKALSGFDNPPFRFDAQQGSEGYLNSSLEGIWLRGPYLHNGSVPTVADLLEPPERRPPTFRRGGNLLDGDRLGFFSGPETAMRGGSTFLFDTRLRGNSNAGHRYGVDLSPVDKRSLLEHLKTL